MGDPSSPTSSSIGGIVQEGFKIKVFSGSSTYFWNHSWLGPITFKQEFPRLFLLSTQKEELISNIWDGLNSGSWALTFKRSLRDRENQQLWVLKQRLQSYVMDPSKSDSLQWRWTEDKKFTVRSVYEQWELLTQDRNSLLGSIWKNLCPPEGGNIGLDGYSGTGGHEVGSNQQKHCAE